MRTTLVTGIIAAWLGATGAAIGQTTPPLAAPAAPLAFEVASVKPTATDQAKLMAAVMAGQMPKVGAHVDGAIAEYTYMSIQELISEAYKVKPYQVTGPDWIKTERFDIHAKMPDGSKKDQAPQMLQALLAERFKLVARRETKEHPVLALVVGKGGSKMKDAPPDPSEPIDEDAPLKPGEMKMDTPEGPVRMTVDMKTGGATMNMGKKGVMTYSMNPATQSMHMEATKVTMQGFAEMLTQFTQMGGAGKTVVDMTELKGNYQVALDFSMADLLTMARAAGANIPPEAAARFSPADAASDPSGTSSVFIAVKALGLNLEQRKAPIEQIIIDHVEKSPTEN
jgi:uncharacterized protein (TIGR03435 family)